MSPDASGGSCPGHQKTSAFGPFLNTCPRDESGAQWQILNTEVISNKSSFLIDEWTWFPNQGQKAASFVSVAPLWAYGGALGCWGPAAESRSWIGLPLGSAVPGAFLCGNCHWWGSWATEAGGSPGLPARSEGQLGYFLLLSANTLWWSKRNFLVQ